jgi:hypothetical protein
MDEDPHLFMSDLCFEGGGMTKTQRQGRKLAPHRVVRRHDVATALSLPEEAQALGVFAGQK